MRLSRPNSKATAGVSLEFEHAASANGIEQLDLKLGSY